MDMDGIDEKLLLALRENGRASTAQLARLVGRSRTSVQSRIARLERVGMVERSPSPSDRPAVAD